MSDSRKLFTRESTPVIAVVLLAFILRIYDLAGESVWFDEAYTLVITHLSFREIIPATAYDVHPPLYFFLMRIWTQAFGESAAVIRFLSVIFGTASIFVLYKLGQQIYSKKAGLIAALFLSLSPLHIHYSQEARMYAAVVFFSFCSLYFLLKVLAKPDKSAIALYLISTACMLYTHSTAFFVLLFENIYVLLYCYYGVRKPFLKSFLPWIYLQLALGLLYSPWALVLLEQWGKVNSGQWGRWVSEASPDKVYELLAYYSGSPSGLIFFSAAILISFPLLIKKYGANYSDLVLKLVFPLLIMLVPILAPFIVSQIFQPLFIQRVTLPSLAGFYLLSAMTICSIPRVKLQVFFTALLSSFLFFETLNYYQRVDKEEWNLAVKLIEETAKPGDTVLFNANFSKDFAYAYYAKRNDLRLVGFPKNHSIIVEQDYQDLMQIVRGKERIFLVRAMTNDSRRHLENILARHFENVVKVEFYHLEVFIFKKANA